MTTTLSEHLTRISQTPTPEAEDISWRLFKSETALNNRTVDVIRKAFDDYKLTSKELSYIEKGSSRHYHRLVSPQTATETDYRQIRKIALANYILNYAAHDPQKAGQAAAGLSHIIGYAQTGSPNYNADDEIIGNFVGPCDWKSTILRSINNPQLNETLIDLLFSSEVDPEDKNAILVMLYGLPKIGQNDRYRQAVEKLYQEDCLQISSALSDECKQHKVEVYEECESYQATTRSHYLFLSYRK